MSNPEPYLERYLANLSEEECDALLARVRPPAEPTDPKERAAAALRRSTHGASRKRRATKEEAAAALRTFGRT